jgi:hypothetical protein
MRDEGLRPGFLVFYKHPGYQLLIIPDQAGFINEKTDKNAKKQETSPRQQAIARKHIISYN